MQLIKEVLKTKRGGGGHTVMNTLLSQPCKRQRMSENHSRKFEVLLGNLHVNRPDSVTTSRAASGHLNKGQNKSNAISVKCKTM